MDSSVCATTVKLRCHCISGLSWDVSGITHVVPAVGSTVQGIAAAVLVRIDVVVDPIDGEGRVLDAVRVATWSLLASVFVLG